MILNTERSILNWHDQVKLLAILACFTTTMLDCSPHLSTPYLPLFICPSSFLPQQTGSRVPSVKSMQPPASMPLCTPQSSVTVTLISNPCHTHTHASQVKKSHRNSCIFLHLFPIQPQIPIAFHSSLQGGS